MTLGALLDVALGVVSIVILFSLAATAIQESIAQTLRRRPRTLEAGLRVLIEARFGTGAAKPAKGLEGRDPGQLTAEFYRRPEVVALARSPFGRLDALWQKLLSIFGEHGARRPSAIPPRVYAETVLRMMENGDAMLEAARRDVEARGQAAAGALDAVMRRIGAGEEVADAPRVVAMLADQLSGGMGAAKAALDREIAALEAEFNATMDRVSGWYARSTRVWLFAIGFALAMGANVDLLQYTRASLGDPQLRARAVELAERLAADQAAREHAALEQLAEAAATAAQEGRPTPDGARDAPSAEIFAQLSRRMAEERETLSAGLEGLGAKVGWRCVDKPADLIVDGWACDGDASAVLPNTPQVIGWFLIAFAVQLGAQFWFQLLKQLLALRTGGKVSSRGADA
ncbi:MAG: hypothetical protein AAF192_17675 [Pseudomonadota bacterium]